MLWLLARDYHAIKLMVVFINDLVAWFR
jgi:hypothetical protein